MKYLIFSFLILFSLNTVFGQENKVSEIQSKSSLGIKYYNEKDYEKALPLLKDVYELTRNSTYYRYYITCMIGLQRYDEAIREIQDELKKQKPPRPDYLIYWGQVLKAQGLKDEATAKYREAIDNVQPNKGSYYLVANAFLVDQEFELARDVYQKAAEVMPDEDFSYELARSYLYLRDYNNMMEAYLNLLKKDPMHLSRIQSSLSSAMRLDIDDGLRDQFREQVLLRIQSEPDVIGYNRLLIWFLLQERKFASALRQSIAIDRRTGEEDQQIAILGDMALRNKEYAEAKKAYQYLLDKGEETSYYAQALIRTLNASFLEYVNDFPEDSVKGKELAQQFNEGLEYLHFGPATLALVREYAHLEAFYLNAPGQAIEVLEKGIAVPGLKPEQTGELKTELADVHLYNNDPWEAMLLYSQVIDENKANSLGDEVKLKKARLGYYMGNFKWAKAQLDVLKASTSKLTANDAMELSMMIGNNLNLDTTAVPLQMFARADLLFFQNRNEQAMAVLDSLEEQFPYNSLVDDILFRKAKLEIGHQNYTLAAEYLQTIVNDFGYELLGDDAMYQLAELYNYDLDQKEKARDLYRSMLNSYPGSVYIEESRAKYRELREVYPDKEEGGKEQLFQRAIENTEF
ncbi:tetratricopeptide repeat protein [Maribellus sp. YY47]|uniref:tetratricopeptide repeat protein n=1 Tax=Maribellus sp. YY47 TaxID=2929486 RepID=UPI002001140D|nr:tetratricopeptide repeat protein [Maribellus sp. YY47]MCK3685511.1 tetratricopeptide repeat protein [Maribellus sp. YY47]